MEYDFKRIGKRIKDLRKAKGWSQDRLIDILQPKVPIGRNTLSAIENGNAKHFELSLLTALCEIFNCEMGHLLCEYECKTREATDIQTVIGLSEPAVNSLRNLDENERLFLNSLLTNRGDFYFIASGFAKFIKKKHLYHAIDAGIIETDFGPETLTIKNDLDFLRFTLLNRFVLFADKEN